MNLYVFAGIGILVLIFGSLFIFAWKLIGLLEAILTFAFVTGLILLITLAVNLLYWGSALRVSG